MSGLFNQQLAIITGGANGIGFAIAQKLVSEGAHAVLLDWQKSAVQKAAKLIGSSASAFQLDVTNEAKVIQTIKKVAKKFHQSRRGLQD